MTVPATYGTETTGGTFVPMSSDDTAQTGDVCQATYTISGLGSYFTGIDSLVGINWQTGVITQLQNTLVAQNCTLLYAKVDPDNGTVFAQYTPNAAATSSAIPGQMEASVIPLIVYEIALDVIAALIAAGIIAWFVIDVVPEAVGKLVDIVESSPEAAVVVYGGMALVGIIAIAYIMKKWRERGDNG